MECKNRLIQLTNLIGFNIAILMRKRILLTERSGVLLGITYRIAAHGGIGQTRLAAVFNLALAYIIPYTGRHSDSNHEKQDSQ